MEKEFIPYEQALELKELGFNEECLALWQSTRKGEPYININCPQNIKALLSGRINNSDVEYIVSAPLWQQAFDWFREKCNLFYVIHVHIEGYSFNIHTLKKEREDIFLFSTLLSSISSGNYITTYGEARQACLEKLIEIAKEQNVNNFRLL